MWLDFTKPDISIVEFVHILLCFYNFWFINTIVILVSFGYTCSPTKFVYSLFWRSQLLATETHHVIIGMIWESLQLNVVSLRHDEVFQQCDTFRKGRSHVGVVVPTVVHYVVDFSTAVFRFVQSVAVSHLQFYNYQ